LTRSWILEGYEPVREEHEVETGDVPLGKNVGGLFRPADYSIYTYDEGPDVGLIPVRGDGEEWTSDEYEEIHSRFKSDSGRAPKSIVVLACDDRVNLPIYKNGGIEVIAISRGRALSYGG